MKVAVIGATGAVGREMMRILEDRAFPVDGFVPLASARSEGLPVTFGNTEHRVRELTVEACRGVDVAFVSAGADTASRYLPEIVANGRKPDIRACGSCHRVEGTGGPENASLTGLPVSYFSG